MFVNGPDRQGSSPGEQVGEKSRGSLSLVLSQSTGQSGHNVTSGEVTQELRRGFELAWPAALL